MRLTLWARLGLINFSRSVASNHVTRSDRHHRFQQLIHLRLTANSARSSRVKTWLSREPCGPVAGPLGFIWLADLRWRARGKRELLRRRESNRTSIPGSGSGKGVVGVVRFAASAAGPAPLRSTQHLELADWSQLPCR